LQEPERRYRGAHVVLRAWAPAAALPWRALRAGRLRFRLSASSKRKSRSMKKLQLIVLSVLAAALACVVCAVPASAAPGDYAWLSSFGAFSSPQAVTVDPTNGDVYVIDAGVPDVQRFDAAGNPRKFAALGTNVLDGSSTPSGYFSFADTVQVAIDRSGGATDGAIYVTNSYISAVEVFTQAGEYAGRLTGASAPTMSGLPCGVAVDGAGRVYVSDYQGVVDRYVPAGSVVADSDFDARLTTPYDTCPIAVDATGAVYTGRSSTVKYAASDFGDPAPTGTMIAPSSTAVAVEPVTNQVFVDEGTQISRYSPSGTLLQTFGSGKIGSSTGLTIDGAHNLLVVDRTNLVVHRFGIPTPGPPVATADPAGNVRPTNATLHGTVDPQADDTTYHFEYGTDTSYGTSVPVPEADLGDGYGPLSVSQALTGLLPDTAYHYRVVATNGLGTATSADQTFATAPATPVTATAVGAVGAELHGAVNPRGALASYHFEYGTDTSYGRTTAEQGAGSGTSVRNVGATIAKLAPSTTYHVRLVATTSIGTVSSEDATFTTLPAPTVTVADATGVGVTDATLHGTVDAHGVDGGTYRFFVAGTTNVYRSATAVTAIPAGSGPQDVTAAVGDLPAGGTYSVVFAATVAGATTYGPAVTFSTREVPRAAPVPPITRPPSYPCEAARIDPLTLECGPGTNTPPVVAPPSNRATTKAKVSGTRATLTITVPGPGRVTVGGKGLNGRTVTVKAKGKVTVAVSLTAPSQSALKHAERRKLSRPATVTFTPTGGTAGRTTVALTFTRG
jgi:hypothetical protein